MSNSQMSRDTLISYCVVLSGNVAHLHLLVKKLEKNSLLFLDWNSLTHKASYKASY